MMIVTLIRILIKTTDVQPTILTMDRMRDNSEAMDRSHRQHSIALSRRALEREGALWFEIDGGSMKPFLRAGDRVLVRSCSADALASGDLVLLTEADTLCLHRVIRSGRSNGRRWLRTKGDGCGRWDLPVEAGSVVGKGVARQRGHRTVPLDGWSGRLLGFLCVYGSVLMGWGLWLKWRFQA
ncbi:MAG: S24/S26 family peptidase [Nitrospirae bacterium]|nr:S24/S26 family peptidase [Nitrospirota bacterium]